MTTVFAALRLKAEEREPYARGAIPEPDLLNEVLEMIHREEEMGAFLKQPLFIADEFIRPFRVGDLVAARFEILREIGEGGMGIVYEALDRKRSQKIAIKAAKRGFRSFLSPEMEGALRVRHPNVCLVNEIHTATTPGGDVDFLTMELLEGQTLAERLLHNGKLPRTEAVEIARQLCAGIAEAHRVGVLHRDLKPSNVILCRFPDGSRRAVITDFGLSCEAGQSEGLSGTPRYMAPELWLGAEPSRASDLYALGVILFEMADGSQPCGPASEKLPGTSRREKDPYCHLTEACLSLKPERRCEEFTRALQPDYWSAGLWTRRKVLTVAAAGVSGLATGGAWWGSDRFGNLLHPLPKKRLVALIAWPPISDSLIKPVVSGVIDGIENELARFEAFDHDLLVLAAKEGDIGEPNNQRVTQICASLGANLALAVTGGLNRG
ncbi:MAG: serine/threonine protein kinase, partial [Acidobacteriaceae bacterium]|nr:serine/threonine protein kinase [Acidobacteriaceae bacterium]